METVSDVLGNIGSPITVDVNGRVLLIRKMDQKSKTQIEQHVKAESRQQILSDREGMSDTEYQLAYGAFLDRVSSGDYKFGGRIYSAFLGSGSGGMFMARMLSMWEDTKKSPDEMEMAGLMMDPDSRGKLELALKQAIQESFPKAKAP